MDQKLWSTGFVEVLEEMKFFKEHLDAHKDSMRRVDGMGKGTRAN
jgi:hypothetical protein